MVVRKQKLPESVFLSLGGGLGDAFWTYHKGKAGWGYIESLKKRYPQVKINVIGTSHNSNVLELIKYNPYITKAENFRAVSPKNRESFEKAHCNQAKRLSTQKRLLSSLTFKRPKIFLNEQDRKVLKKIQGAGPFVLIHPFAGLRRRCSGTEKEYIPLIDWLVDDKKVNTVVIGNDHKRLTQNEKKVLIMKERFDYERPGLFNLVNKGNPRLYYHLAKHQEYFIGSWSAYSVASWLHNKLTILLVSEKPEKNLRKRFNQGQRWEGKKHKIISLGNEKNLRPPEEVTKEVFRTIKEL